MRRVPSAFPVCALALLPATAQESGRPDEFPIELPAEFVTDAEVERACKRSIRVRALFLF